MKKSIVRQLQKFQNRMNVCISPEICEMLQAEKGDNLLFNPDPDHPGTVRVSKVGPVPSNPVVNAEQQDETRQNSEDGSGAGDAVSKFGFCTNCGSENIEVVGNRLYCGECDVLYEVTPKGTKVIESNPRKKTAYAVDSVESRIEQIEQNLGEHINSESSEKEDEDEPDGFIKWEPDLVAIGSEQVSETDEDETDEDEPDGFISW